MFKAENYNAGLFKVCLSVLLLTQSMVLQAGAKTSTGEVEEPAAENSAAAVQTETTAARTEAAAAPAEVVTPSSSVQRGLRGNDFPKWSKRKKTNRSDTPPPPPGPYMSTALSDYPVSGLATGHGVNKPEHRSQVEPEAESDSMKMYSPDRPWPNSLRPSNRWKPENGYQFHGDQQNMKSRMPPMQMPPRRAPVMPAYGSRQASQSMATVPNYQGGYYARPPASNPNNRTSNNGFTSRPHYPSRSRPPQSWSQQNVPSQNRPQQSRPPQYRPPQSGPQ